MNQATAHLFNATEKGNLNDVKSTLLSGVADVNHQDEAEGNTALHVAIKGNYLEIVRELLAQGADVNLRNYAGEVPLHKAAQLGFLKVVELLLKKDPDIDVQTECTLATPLHYAAEGGHLVVVQVLLNKGADINIEDRDGKRPLYKAADGRHLKVTKVLIDAIPNDDLQFELKSAFNLGYKGYENNIHDYTSIMQCILERIVHVGLTTMLAALSHILEDDNYGLNILNISKDLISYIFIQDLNLNVEKYVTNCILRDESNYDNLQELNNDLNVILNGTSYDDIEELIRHCNVCKSEVEQIRGVHLCEIKISEVEKKNVSLYDFINIKNSEQLAKILKNSNQLQQLNLNQFPIYTKLLSRQIAKGNLFETANKVELEGLPKELVCTINKFLSDTSRLSMVLAACPSSSDESFVPDQQPSSQLSQIEQINRGISQDLSFFEQTRP